MGGCVGGAGTIQAPVKSAALVKKFAEESPYENRYDKEQEEAE